MREVSKAVAEWIAQDIVNSLHPTRWTRANALIKKLAVKWSRAGADFDTVHRIQNSLEDSEIIESRLKKFGDVWGSELRLK